MSRYIFLILGLFVSFVANAQDIPCEPESGCSDPCIYFQEGITFLPSSEPAFLKYKGQVFKLKVGKTKILKTLDRVARPEGHIEETTYTGNNMKVIWTSEVINQSCYYQDKNGKWQSEDKCCGGSSKVKLKITESGKSKIYRTTWDWGC